MSFYALVSGVLAADPVSRSGSKVPFATASLRVETGAHSKLFVSLIGFGGNADELLDHTAGEPLSVCGRGEILTWTDRSGAQRHGLKIVVAQIAALKPRRHGAGGARPRPASGRARSQLASVPPGRSRPLPDDTVGDLWRGDGMRP